MKKILLGFVFVSLFCPFSTTNASEWIESGEDNPIGARMIRQSAKIQDGQRVYFKSFRKSNEVGASESKIGRDEKLDGMILGKNQFFLTTKSPASEWTKDKNGNRAVAEVFGPITISDSEKFVFFAIKYELPPRLRARFEFFDGKTGEKLPDGFVDFRGRISSDFSSVKSFFLKMKFEEWKNPTCKKYSCRSLQKSFPKVEDFGVVAERTVAKKQDASATENLIKTESVENRKKRLKKLRLPDIVVENAEFHREFAGEKNVLVAKLCNRGTSDFKIRGRKNIKIKFSSPNATREKRFLQIMIRAGECSKSVVRIPVKYLKISKSGTKKISIFVDSAKNIRELDEKNNKFEKNIEIDFDAPKRKTQNLELLFKKSRERVKKGIATTKNRSRIRTSKKNNIVQRRKIKKISRIPRKHKVLSKKRSSAKKRQRRKFSGGLNNARSRNTRASNLRMKYFKKNNNR